MFDVKKFISQCRRVIHVASKPGKDEFEQSSKITGIGMVIIGAVGFIIFMMFHLIGGA